MGGAAMKGTEGKHCVWVLSNEGWAVVFRGPWWACYYEASRWPEGEAEVAEVAKA